MISSLANSYKKIKEKNLRKIDTNLLEDTGLKKRLKKRISWITGSAITLTWDKRYCKSY